MMLILFMIFEKMYDSRPENIKIHTKCCISIEQWTSLFYKKKKTKIVGSVNDKL